MEKERKDEENELEPEPEMSQMGGSGNPGLRRYSMKLKKNLKKVHKSNKRYETRVKGIELKGRLQILKKKMRNYETKPFISFCETTRNTFFRIFVFFSVSRNDRNSAKQ